MYERGLGPKPINLPKTKELSVEYLKSSLLDIKSGKYDENCKKISQKLQKENGCKVATDILEEYMKEKK